MPLQIKIEKPEKTAPQSSFLAALEGKITPSVPFWLMRQAGRYLPEYREVRRQAGGFLNLCFTPDLATEVTLQPVRRFGMDAAILFSDILVVPHALGQALEFAEGEGPRLSPVKSEKDIENLSLHRMGETLSPVFETVRRVRNALDGDKALIGFAGAPWTVACYMVQGCGGEEFAAAKKFAFTQERIFQALIDKLVDATGSYLLRQIDSGADAVQIFDSWAGFLPQPYFDRWVTEPTRRIVAEIQRRRPGFPVIGFPRGAGMLYPAYARKTGIAALGVDTYVPLEEMDRELDGRICLQGNLDPVLLLAGGKAMEDGVTSLLKKMEKTPFIFNLGHGVIKETPPEHVAALAAIVKNFRRGNG